MGSIFFSNYFERKLLSHFKKIHIMEISSFKATLDQIARQASKRALIQQRICCNQRLYYEQE